MIAEELILVQHLLQNTNESLLASDTYSRRVFVQTIFISLLLSQLHMFVDNDHLDLRYMYTLVEMKS